MKTAYRRNIPSPIQLRHEQVFNITNPKHPAREEIKKSVGVYNLTAEFNEDSETLSMFKQVSGLVAFLCTLKKDGKVIGQGRGTAVLNRVNRYIERTVHTAFNASLIDAVVRSTKMLDALCGNNETLEEAYQIKERGDTEPITDRQRSYLLELIHTNVSNEDEREQWESRVDELTKAEASTAIASFAK